MSSKESLESSEVLFERIATYARQEEISEFEVFLRAFRSIKGRDPTRQEIKDIENRDFKSITHHISQKIPPYVQAFLYKEMLS